ncbi:MAG TPA: tyrosine-type recombinase/integrase [Acidimicrobiales bacterium]
MAALRRRSVDLLNRRLLVVENVVEVGGVLITGTPKSGEGRTVPILTNLLDPLAEHLAIAPPSADASLFIGPKGAPLRYSWWRRNVWAPACHEVGLDVPIHALRHSAGKALANAGVPAVVIKSFMGHASAAFSIDVYGHTSPTDLDDAAERLDTYRHRSLQAGTGLVRFGPRDARGIVAGSKRSRPS